MPIVMFPLASRLVTHLFACSFGLLEATVAMSNTPHNSSVDHELSTSYFDDSATFFTAGVGGEERNFRHVPELFEPLTNHRVESQGYRGSPRRVRQAVDAGANEENPGDVALKNLLLLSHNLPVSVEANHTIRPRHKPRENAARKKWSVIDFKDPEAIKFRAQLNKAVIDHRKVFAECNAIVKFPEKVPNEALSYAAPRFGPEWEMFDGVKHVDYEAAERLNKRRARLEEVKAVHKEQEEAVKSLWSFEEIDEEEDDVVVPLSAALEGEEEASSKKDRNAKEKSTKYSAIGTSGAALLPTRRTTINMNPVAPFFRSGVSHFDAKPGAPEDGKEWQQMMDDL